MCAWTLLRTLFLTTTYLRDGLRWWLPSLARLDSRGRLSPRKILLALGARLSQLGRAEMPGYVMRRCGAIRCGSRLGSRRRWWQEWLKIRGQGSRLRRENGERAVGCVRRTR